MRTRRVTITLIALIVAITAGLGTAEAKKKRPKREKYFASRDLRLHMPKPKDPTEDRPLEELLNNLRSVRAQKARTSH